MFWTCDQTNVDRTVMFQLLLYSTDAAPRPPLFLTLHCQASRLMVHETLGEDTAGTADPNLPKGYSVPYDVMFSNKI